MALTRAQFNMIKGKGYLLAEVAALTDYEDGQWIYISGRDTAGDDYEGMFVFNETDLSTEVTSDTLQGIYLAPDADDTGGSGAWVRDWDWVNAQMLWFGPSTTPAANINAAGVLLGTLAVDGRTAGGLFDVSESNGATVNIPVGYFIMEDQVLFYSGIRYKGNTMLSTVLDFSGIGAKSAFIPGTSYFWTGAIWHAYFEDFSIAGDQGKDQSGSNLYGFYFDDCQYCGIDRVGINAFTDAVHLEGASYYNDFNFYSEYNYRSLYIPTGCYVNTVKGGKYAVRSDQTNMADYQFVVEGDSELQMTRGSMDADNNITAHTYSEQGKLDVAARWEGAPCAKIGMTGYTGQCKIHMAGGTTSYIGTAGSPTIFGDGVIILDDIDTPFTQDWHLHFGIDIGVPNGNRCSGLIHDPTFRFGVTNAVSTSGWFWSTSANVDLVYLTQKSDLFMSKSGIRLIAKTATDGKLTHNFVVNSAATYVVFIAKVGTNAIMEAKITGLTGHDTTRALFGTIVDYGNGWKLYAAEINDYASSDITAVVQIGHEGTSAVGSTIDIAYCDVFTGGFPLFPMVTDRNTITYAAPDRGTPNIGDVAYLDAPSVGSPLGYVCVDRNDSTLDVAAIATDTDIYLADITGMAINDYIGIELDDGTQHWSYITALGADYVTINDALPSAAAIGNLAITWQRGSLANVA